MKILLTGGTGFIGSRVAEKLLESGYQVRCMIRKTSNLRWLDGKNYELVEGSLSDKVSLINAAKDVDYVYHIAGNTSAKNLDEYMKGNCQGTINLLEAVLQAAPNLQRFLYVSSQTAAGPSLEANNPVTVDSPMHPLTDYGRSKKAAEEAVHSYSEKIPFTIVRPPAVYGPRDTEIFSIFQIVNTGIIPFIGFNDKLLSLVHIEDLADGIIAAAESRNTLGKTYFVSSEEIYNWKDVYMQMKTALGKKHTLSIHLPHFSVKVAGGVSGFLGSFGSKPPVFNYQKAIDFTQAYWTCSVKSAMKDFGYRQKVSLKDGIASTVAWYKEHQWLK